ncbi:N-acetylmuramoyl-L-alanine amidase [Nonomuraea sp. NPDC000554]|uniref:N-acetylmuramoyl-L-alanine amidase n=1 Tax=Nonomuraea sp. NPDC000554 TaxID=3154259 RepID=UPI0033253640
MGVVMLVWLAIALAASGLAVPPPGRQEDFARAAREYGLPVSVLLAVSYLESRWDAHAGSPSTSGGYGPMHLVDVRAAGRHLRAAAADGNATRGDSHGDAREAARGGARDHVRRDADWNARGDDRGVTRDDVAGPAASREALPESTLRQAAELTGLRQAVLRRDPAANIRAGAALLASYQRQPSDDPAAWYDAVARYSGAGDRLTARRFADEVFSVIAEGATRRTDDGTVVRLTAVPGLRVPRPDAEATATGNAATDGGTRTGGEAATGGGRVAEGGAAVGGDTAVKGDHAADGGGVAAGGEAAGDGEVVSGGGVVGGEVAEGGGAGDALPGGRTAGEGAAECPASLACQWMPAAFRRFDHRTDYGNHDRVRESRRIDYIVIHDTEGTYQGIRSMVHDPEYVSWHYTIRSRDGHIAQHVRTKDIAWHAGNWDFNARSIGIEHEGYLARGGTWYTEAMYQASARLVKYLAAKYDIPLDRAHILGHDNVPGSTPETLPGMHEDPGPYWDWAHYFDLLGSPFEGTGRAATELVDDTGVGGDEGAPTQGAGRGTSALSEGPQHGTSLQVVGHGTTAPADRARRGTSAPAVGPQRGTPGRNGGAQRPASVLILPGYAENRPHFTGCSEKRPCADQGASTVWLRTEPREDAPLVDDVGKRVGKPSTRSVYDHSARASTGQRFAVAGTQGDWTAIWYLGSKAWFYNPPAQPTAVPAKGPLVTPLKSGVRVYGRAYPEQSAYRGKGVTYQTLTPLPYVIQPGQLYSLGFTLPASYYSANSYSPARHVMVRGGLRYHQIQLGHRVAFVKAEDVRVIR